MSDLVTGTIAQCRFLNRLLASKDMSLITVNNLDSSYFCDYQKEFKYIHDFIDKYNALPDLITFQDAFPDFDVLNVGEPNEFIIDSLYADKNKRLLASSFNKIKDLIESNNVEEAMNFLIHLENSASQAKHLSYTSIVSDTSRYDEYIKRCSDFTNYYVTTGFRELDEVVGGWDRKEENAVIVARTNMGKSWLLMKSAAASAMVGLRVGIFSGEMTRSKVGYRIDTLISHISNSGMTHGDINIQDDYRKYIESLNKTIKGDIFVLTPNDVGGSVGVTVLKGFIESAKLDILFIDQYSLLDDDERGRDSVTRMSNISKGIKNLQVRTQIPIISVSQQNRGSTDNGVGNELIAQSDRIGQDATIVLFFEYKDGIGTMTLTKSRDSSNSKKLKYAWDINHGTFEYLPEDNDATGGSSCDDLKHQYDMDTDEGNDGEF